MRTKLSIVSAEMAASGIVQPEHLPVDETLLSCLGVTCHESNVSANTTDDP